MGGGFYWNRGEDGFWREYEWGWGLTARRNRVCHDEGGKVESIADDNNKQNQRRSIQRTGMTMRGKEKERVRARTVTSFVDG